MKQLPAATYPLWNLFSIEAQNTLEIFQEATSDIVSISYTSSDPGICYNTMLISIDQIIRNVKAIKAIESSDIVKYYREATQESQDRLNAAEAELASFMNGNKVINYYEETKLISARKENFTQNYQDEKLLLVSEEAKLANIEGEVSIQKQQKLKNGEILSLREDLANINTAIELIKSKSMMEINPDEVIKSTAERDSTLASLEKRAVELESELREKVFELFANDGNVHGNNTENIALVWLETVLNIEKSKARLLQYEIFTEDFEVTYTAFSKLGSNIKRLERKINVLEREYLEMLSNLNAAKMRQQSLELSGELRVTDDPFYPSNPEKSKMVMTMIVGGLAGAIFVLATLILLDFLDKSIKSIERFETFTRLTLKGAFPVLNPKKLEDSLELRNKLLTEMTNFIHEMFLAKTEKKDEPFNIVFSSSRRKEGKTQLTRSIAAKLRTLGDQVLVLNPKQEDQHELLDVASCEDDIYYEIPTNFRDFGTVLNELVEGVDSSKYKYVFVELPELIGNDLPLSLIKFADLNFYIAKANRTWSPSDILAIEKYAHLATNDMFGILNGTHIYELEPIIGEIPKKEVRLEEKSKRLLLSNLNAISFSAE